MFAEVRLLSQLAVRLEGVHRKSNDALDCYCPFCCTDQKTRRRENRTAGLHAEKGFHCFRASCPSHELSRTGGGLSLRTFTKHIAPDLVEDFDRERRAEERGSFANVAAHVGLSISEAPPPPRDETLLTPEEALEFVNSLPRCIDLPDDHPAHQWFVQRQLTELHAHYCRWIGSWEVFAHACDGGEHQHGPRVLIPYISQDGTRLLAASGRTLDSAVRAKYIAVKTAPENPLLFGLDLVDPSQDIFVLEGPLDAMFLPNAVATTGSNLTNAAAYLPKNKLVLVYDFQPVLADKMIHAAEEGFRVCVPWFPTATPKDINELVQGGLASSLIAREIRVNNFSGGQAIGRIRRWRSI